jgi:anti-sigma28 factor (negative regulator of flagellin synthesis)
MKINPIANPNISREYVSTKPVKEKTKVTGGRDEVTFSEEALSFSKALAEARDTIEFRTPEEKAHIADITTAVRQGTYKVDSYKVAEKILESIQRRE